MKGQIVFRLSLLAAVTSISQGASYTSDFNSAALGAPLVAAPAVTGVDGWTQSQANADNTMPKAWIASFGPPSASAKGVVIGAFYDPYAGSTSFHINRALSWSLTGSAVSMTIAIADSTAGFPHRNNFSVGLLDSGGGNLVRVDFTANSQNFIAPTQSQRSWNVSVNGGAAFAAVLDGSSYRLFMDFLATGPNATYSVDITDFEPVPTTFTGTGTVTGGASANIGNLRFGTTLGAGSDWGDNTFAATGIMVPEPSSTLLLGIGALGLFRRRRS